MAVRAGPCDDFGMPGADLRMLVEEQAALKRVAVTVATETAAERVFDVVTEEVARLLGADAANLVSFGPRPEQGSSSASGASPASRSRATARSSRSPAAAPSTGSHGRERRRGWRPTTPASPRSSTNGWSNSA